MSGCKFGLVEQNSFSYCRPPDKSVFLKIIFLMYVVGTQKNRLNVTVLLSTQNTCLNLWVRK